LERLGWDQGQLASQRKSHPGKLAIAVRLRQETTLPLKAIAACVHLGSSKSANARLHQWMRQIGPARPQPTPVTNDKK
jgi:hypothetical protein